MFPIVGFGRVRDGVNGAVNTATTFIRSLNPMYTTEQMRTNGVAVEMPHVDVRGMRVGNLIQGVAMVNHLVPPNPLTPVLNAIGVLNAVVDLLPEEAQNADVEAQNAPAANDEPPEADEAEGGGDAGDPAQRPNDGQNRPRGGGAGGAALGAALLAAAVLGADGSPNDTPSPDVTPPPEGTNALPSQEGGEAADAVIDIPVDGAGSIEGGAPTIGVSESTLMLDAIPSTSGGSVRLAGSGCSGRMGRSGRWSSSGGSCSASEFVRDISITPEKSIQLNQEANRPAGQLEHLPALLLCNVPPECPAPIAVRVDGRDAANNALVRDFRCYPGEPVLHTIADRRELQELTLRGSRREEVSSDALLIMLDCEGKLSHGSIQDSPQLSLRSWLIRLEQAGNWRALEQVTAEILAVLPAGEHPRLEELTIRLSATAHENAEAQRAQRAQRRVDASESVFLAAGIASSAAATAAIAFAAYHWVNGLRAGLSGWNLFVEPLNAFKRLQERVLFPDHELTGVVVDGVAATERNTQQTAPIAPDNVQQEPAAPRVASATQVSFVGSENALTAQAQQLPALRLVTPAPETYLQFPEGLRHRPVAAAADASLDMPDLEASDDEDAAIGSQLRLRFDKDEKDE